MSQDSKRPGSIRKRIIGQSPERSVGGAPEWLEVEKLAEVEVTSEDPGYPVERALVPGEQAGWRAAEPGRQLIRVVFDQPRTLHRIYLHFVEAECERHQEFVLRWAGIRGGSRQEIVRQQWNFSPSGSTHEIEDYRPAPFRAALVELEIVPDTSGGEARASLQHFYLA